MRKIKAGFLTAMLLVVAAIFLTGADYSWHKEFGATLGTDGRSWSNVFLKNTVTFEGATSDANETTISVTEPTADRTITVPNVSGRLPVANNLDTWGVTLWANSDDTTDTGDEVCALSGLTCVDAKLVNGTDSACTTDNGVAGTYFYALCK